MAHAFTVINSSNVTVVYTDYDAIDLVTLKHVISFNPDLGTLVASNEIFVETGTLNSAAVQGVMLETNNTVIDTDGTSHSVPAEEKLLLEDGDQFLYEAAAIDALGKMVPEDFAAGLENHLMLETASDSQTADHHHTPIGEPHVDGDGHSDAEHRELGLWPHRLGLLMARERLNNASS